MAKQQTADWRILVPLFGALEFDGRAQRMVELLSSIGRVHVVDTGAPASKTVGTSVVSATWSERTSVPASAHRVRRHMTLWRSVLRVAREFRPHLVVAENFFVCVPGWLAARRARAKFVYDAYELVIPEEGVPQSARDVFWYSMERLIVGRADVVVAANRERAELMRGHYHLGKAPLVMRNIPREAPAGGLDAELLRQMARFPQDGRVVLYQGDVSLSRGIAKFVEALNFLPSDHRMVIVGDGHDLPSLLERHRSLVNSGRLIALGRVPNAKLRALTSLAHVGIICYAYDGLNNILCSPNKLFEYAQAGVPIVATDQPPLKSAIEQYGIGVAVSRNEGPQAIADALKSVASESASYRVGLAKFVRDNSWEGEASNIRAAFSRLLGDG